MLLTLPNQLFAPPFNQYFCLVSFCWSQFIQHAARALTVVSLFSVEDDSVSASVLGPDHDPQDPDLDPHGHDLEPQDHNLEPQDHDLDPQDTDTLTEQYEESERRPRGTM